MKKAFAKYFAGKVLIMIFTMFEAAYLYFFWWIESLVFASSSFGFVITAMQADDYLPYN